MTEFTKEWIEEQKKYKQTLQTVEIRKIDENHTYIVAMLPAEITTFSGKKILEVKIADIHGAYSRVIEMRAKAIVDCINYYFLALDEIERQQSQIKELETFQELSDRWANQYYKDIEKLKKRIAELEQERRWIPVSEMPKYYGEYLVRRHVLIKGVPAKTTMICHFTNIDGWGDDNITHWRQLPQEEE